MKITDILQPSCVRVPLQAADKPSAIEELIGALADSGQIADRNEVLETILAREQTRSTGIGLGLAVPHGKSSGCQQLTMAVGKPAAPIDYESIDRKPCDFIVLLASPIDQTGPHIKALSSISRLWLNEEFRGLVLKAKSSDDVYSAFAQFQGD